MENHEAHPLEHAAVHARDDLVVDLAVSRVSPPGENIGAGENVVGEPVLRHVERGRARLEMGVLAKPLGDALVHGLRIHLGNHPALSFVHVLAPDGDANHDDSFTTSGWIDSVSSGPVGWS